MFFYDKFLYIPLRLREALRLQMVYFKLFFSQPSYFFDDMLLSVPYNWMIMGLRMQVQDEDGHSSTAQHP